MIEAGVVKAFLSQVGLDIGNQQIAQFLPSDKTFDKYETELAADCILKVCYEIKLDHDGERVIKLCLITDHGHRKDQDHFVKLICWAGFDEDGNWTIKYHCLDVDIAGHSAKEAAEAVRTSSAIFVEVLQFIVGDDVEVEFADVTGDTGGGAAVHRLHPALVEIRVMKALSHFLGCDMHAWNKPLEVASVETFGKQGIGCCTPFQLLWLFVQILKTVRKKLTKTKLNQLWGEAVEELRNNSSWQTKAREE